MRRLKRNLMVTAKGCEKYVFDYRYIIFSKLIPTPKATSCGVFSLLG